MTSGRTLHVRCATWEQVEVFHTRKLRRGKLLSMKVPFPCDPGTGVTLNLELPNQVVIVIEGVVQKAAPVEPDKLKALKATLKSEREKRKATEIRLRRLLSALKVKLEGVGDVPGDIELDRILWASLEATFAEHLDALVAEEDDPELEPGREVELRADAELTRALILRVRM